MDTWAWALVVAGGSLSLLLATLAGLWIGFRLSTRDVALIAATGTRADAASTLAKEAIEDVKRLADLFEDHAERMERKRASIVGSLSSLERKRSKVQEEEAAAPPVDPLAGLTGRERRLALARIHSGRGLQ